MEAKQVKELVKHQFLFLKLIWSRSNSDTSIGFTPKEIATELELNKDTTNKILDRLTAGEMIKRATYPEEKIFITLNGVKEVERVIVLTSELTQDEKKFFGTLYLKGEQDPSLSLDWEKVGDEIGLNPSASGDLIKQLEIKGLVTTELDGMTNITNFGFSVGIETIELSNLPYAEIKYKEIAEEFMKFAKKEKFAFWR